MSNTLQQFQLETVTAFFDAIATLDEENRPELHPLDAPQLLGFLIKNPVTFHFCGLQFYRLDSLGSALIENNRDRVLSFAGRDYLAVAVSPQEASPATTLAPTCDRCGSPDINMSGELTINDEGELIIDVAQPYTVHCGKCGPQENADVSEFRVQHIRVGDGSC